MYTLVVGGVDLYETYGFALANGNVFDRANKDIEEYDIPGRNGKLYFDTGKYNNFNITYELYYSGGSDGDWNYALDSMINDLLSQFWSENTYIYDNLVSTSRVRIGKYKGVTIHSSDRKGCQISIVFDVKPELWWAYPISGAAIDSQTIHLSSDVGSVISTTVSGSDALNDILNGIVLTFTKFATWTETSGYSFEIINGDNLSWGFSDTHSGETAYVGTTRKIDFITDDLSDFKVLPSDIRYPMPYLTSGETNALRLYSVGNTVTVEVFEGKY